MEDLLRNEEEIDEGRFHLPIDLEKSIEATIQTSLDDGEIKNDLEIEQNIEARIQNSLVTDKKSEEKISEFEAAELAELESNLNKSPAFLKSFSS